MLLRDLAQLAASSNRFFAQLAVGISELLQLLRRHRDGGQVTRAGTVGSRLLDLAPRPFAIVLAAGLVPLVIVNWTRWVGSAGAQWTDDAYLQADLTPLSAQVAGRISRVAVGDFQRVQEGELLVEIDDRPFRAQLDQAEANVAAAQAAIANLKSQELLRAANIGSACRCLSASMSGCRGSR